MKQLVKRTIIAIGITSTPTNIEYSILLGDHDMQATETSIRCGG